MFLLLLLLLFDTVLCQPVAYNNVNKVIGEITARHALLATMVLT